MGGNWSAERGVKRPHENTEPENETSTGDLSDSSSDLHTPKRKRFQSTAQYIVKKLFEEGTDSDVTIRALGKSWHLHRIYLSQCKYFDSMFSGQWLESEQPDIVIEITDENVDAEALRIAFKSLYTDNILVKPIQAVGVLAAATFLQLDPLIEHCRIVMKGCITCKTACSFLAASECYGLLDIRDLCMSWLLRCLMVPKNAFMLSDIREELLVSLLDSRELWIMQVEVDVYCLLKKWVFTQLNPSWNGNSEQLYKDASDFYKQQAENNGCCFLETAEGRRFIHMFERVRWMYIINDVSCIQSLKDDQLVPYDWLNPVFSFCWNHHLRVEQGLDIGPREVSEEDFYKWSMRCGRVLMHEQEYHWRWLGYTYGLDLLFTLRNRALTISRNCGTSQRFPGSLSQQETRHVMLCVKVSHIKKKEVCAVFSTGIKTLALQTDDVESFLLALSPAVKFPMQVTMQLLYISPDPSQPFPSFSVPPLPVDVVPSTPPPSTPSTPPPSTPPPSNPATGSARSAVGESESRVCADTGSQRRAACAHSSGDTPSDISSRRSAGGGENESGVCADNGCQRQAACAQSSGDTPSDISSGRSAGGGEYESGVCADTGSHRQTACAQSSGTSGGDTPTGSNSTGSVGDGETQRRVCGESEARVCGENGSQRHTDHSGAGSGDAFEGTGGVSQRDNSASGGDLHRESCRNDLQRERAAGRNDLQRDSSASGNDLQRESSAGGNDLQRESSASGNDLQRDSSASGNDLQRDSSAGGNDLQRDSSASGNDLQRDSSASMGFVQTDDSSADQETLTASWTMKDTTTACSQSSDECSSVPATSQSVSLLSLKNDESRPIVVISSSGGTNMSAAKPSFSSATRSSSVLSSATASVSTVVLSSTAPSKKAPSACSQPSDRNAAGCSNTADTRSSASLPSCVDLPSCSSWSSFMRKSYSDLQGPSGTSGSPSRQTRPAAAASRRVRRSARVRSRQRNPLE